MESKERLTFLKAFLHGLGLKYKDVTEVSSFSSLNTCFDKDDMGIASAAKIVSHFGYRLTIRMSPDYMAPDELRRKQFKRNHGPLLDCVETLRVNLGMTQRDFARQFGMCQSGYNHILDVDNTQISKLFKIAKCFNARLIIRIEPASNPMAPLPYQTIDMHIVRRLPITEKTCQRVWDDPDNDV